MKQIHRIPFRLSALCLLVFPVFAGCAGEGTSGVTSEISEESPNGSDTTIPPSPPSSPSKKEMEDFAGDEVIAPTAPVPPSAAPEAAPPPSPETLPAAGAAEPLAVSLEGTEAVGSHFGVVQVRWSVKGTPAKVLLYGTSLNRKGPQEGCEKTPDGRFLAVNPPVAGGHAANLKEGSSNFQKYEKYASGEECVEAQGNCPVHKDEPAAPTVCAIDLTNLGAGETFYTLAHQQNPKFVLAAQDANGEWQVDQKRIELGVPSLDSSVTVSETEPVADIHAKAWHSSRAPIVAGCPNPQNVFTIQHADGTSEYSARCPIEKDLAIVITAVGAEPASFDSDEFQVSLAASQVTLTHAGGTCDMPGLAPGKPFSVAWNDPASCEYTGTVKLAAKTEGGYEVLKNGASVSKGSVSWAAAPKIFVKTYDNAYAQTGERWEEIPSKPGEAFSVVPRDHDHFEFLAEVPGANGASAVRSNVLSFPYTSTFNVLTRTDATASLEDANGYVSHVVGEFAWRGRHLRRLTYACTSKMNPHGIDMWGSSENIASHPTPLASGDYGDQGGPSSVESIFPLPTIKNPFNPNPDLCWQERIECTIKAKGYDGKDYESSVAWTLNSAQSKFFSDAAHPNTYAQLPAENLERTCKSGGYY